MELREESSSLLSSLASCLLLMQRRRKCELLPPAPGRLKRGTAVAGAERTRRKEILLLALTWPVVYGDLRSFSSSAFALSLHSSVFFSFVCASSWQLSGYFCLSSYFSARMCLLACHVQCRLPGVHTSVHKVWMCRRVYRVFFWLYAQVLPMAIMFLIMFMGNLLPSTPPQVKRKESETVFFLHATVNRPLRRRFVRCLPPTRMRVVHVHTPRAVLPPFLSASAKSLWRP